MEEYPDESSDDEAGGNEDEADATESKLKNKQSDEVGYDTDEDDDEEKDDDEMQDSLEDKEKESGEAPKEAEEAEEDEVVNEEDMDDELGATDTVLEDEAVRMHVMKTSELINDFVFDKKEHRWCQVTFHMPLKYKDIDFTKILRDIAEKCVVWEVMRFRLKSVLGFQ